jgi:hypothetical protein
LIVPINKVNPPNIKNTAYDPRLSLIIGAIIRQKEELSQFRVVAKGTTFAGII